MRFRRTFLRRATLVLVTILCTGPAHSLSKVFRTGLNDAQASIAPDSQPTGATEAASLLHQLESAVQHNQIATARQFTGKLIHAGMLTSQQWLDAGHILIGAGLYEEAARIFSRCAELHPDEFACQHNLVLAQLAAGQPQAALASVNRIPAKHRDQPAFHYLRGKALAAVGDSKLAEHELSLASAGAPDEENYSLDLAMQYVHDARYSQAVESLQPALARHSQSPFLWLGLSLAQFYSGRYPECEASARRALSLDSQLPAARLLLAYALFVEGDVSQAESESAKGLAQNPNDPYLNYFDADMLLRIGSSDSGRMLRQLAVARARITNCALCSLTESKIHERGGDLAAAIRALNEAVEADPHFADAWYRLARLEQQAGRTEDAQAAEAQFKKLKTVHREDENQRLRSLFLQALGQPAR